MDVYNLWIDKTESKKEYDITPVEQPEQGENDAVIATVVHHQFKQLSIDSIRVLDKDDHLLYDKNILLPQNKWMIG